jgi:hypothetical protein
MPIEVILIVMFEQDGFLMPGMNPLPPEAMEVHAKYIYC